MFLFLQKEPGIVELILDMWHSVPLARPQAEGVFLQLQLLTQHLLSEDDIFEDDIIVETCF